MTSDAVGDVGDDAEVVRDQDHAGARSPRAARCSSLEDLRLDRHVERGRRLVGDQQLGRRRRAPSRSSRAGACRPRTRAGSARSALGRARDADALQQLDGALDAPRPCRRPSCARICSTICVADPLHRVERRHRVLEDHRDLRRRGCAAARSSDARRRAPCPSKRRVPVEARVGRAREPHQRHRRSPTCPQPDSPTIAEHLAGVDVERDAVDGLHEPVLGARRRRAGPRPRAGGSQRIRASSRSAGSAGRAARR